MSDYSSHNTPHIVFGLNMFVAQSEVIDSGFSWHNTKGVGIHNVLLER